MQPLNVYRNGKWAKLPGNALLPGDVVSVARSGGWAGLWAGGWVGGQVGGTLG